MAKLIHPIAGTIALLMILSFWLATAMSELFAGPEAVATVKSSVLWGFLILIPALMAVGGSGFQLGKHMRGPLIAAKKQRMPFIAANGLLILMPSAFYLSFKAQAGAFDTGFYIVQAVELCAGAVNILLLGMNMSNGIRLTRNRRRKTV
ncbi:hypothetical protein ERN12_14465 [Rhodobacteraceae bacterium]|nr:hypothetical protein ERN12_14465 [Paracoccaceae bacterium]